MARGLVSSLQIHTREHFVSTLVSTLIQIPKYPFPVRSRSAKCTRFFCGSCSHEHQQHGAVDMSKYREAFARRMAMAGLKPHHRIAIGVSGGPDSMALCVLAAGWKVGGSNAISKQGVNYIGGLLGIIVDHGLRTESSEEANLVYHRIVELGIKCEIAHCQWLDGRPKPGHLQEAARDKRYEILQNVCMQHQIAVLLIAHHSDDQAELFVLRLSRNSGVLGLAGTAFTSQLFTRFPDFSVEALGSSGILLVRPLLEFSKEDMYKICRGANQEWVEDPTNQSPLYARNRIRMSLSNLTSESKTELLAIISACRRTRCYVDRVCRELLNKAVTIMPGYAIIDLRILNPKEVKDLCLTKFLTMVLQFISQRHRPIRGSALKLLLDYIRTSPCKTSLTVSGCYLSPAPASKGTRVLVCCSIDSSLPQKMELVHENSYKEQNKSVTSELGQIIADGMAHSDRLIQEDSSVPFLDVTSSESVLSDAQRLGLISDSTHRSITSLQKHESESFKCKSKIISDAEVEDEKVSADVSSKAISCGQKLYFMNRYLISWNVSNEAACNLSSTGKYDCGSNSGEEREHCNSCKVNNVVAEVRHMIDADWIYLSTLTKTNVGYSLQQNQNLAEMELLLCKSASCLAYAKISAHRALLLLKSIPVAARRAMPVLVDPQGLLLSIPSVGFQHCPCLMVSAIFKPRVPLGGGHSLFL